MSDIRIINNKKKQRESEKLMHFHIMDSPKNECSVSHN